MRRGLNWGSLLEGKVDFLARRGVETGYELSNRVCVCSDGVGG